ncbi:MAG TPA: M20/M25/M40 family metallo-hydrolase [Ktedonobacterales bacterium]
MTSAGEEWAAEVEALTRRLMAINSVSPGAGELALAREILTILTEGDVGAGAYAGVALEAIPGDAHGRANVWAFVRGSSPRTVALTGHFDTVGYDDYGALEPYARDPDALAAHLDELTAMTPGLAEQIAGMEHDLLFGRGSVDMKSGVAIHLAIMRRAARLAREGHLPFSLVLLTSPDEENESAGVLAGVEVLRRLRDREGLTYLGGINTDTTLPRYPGDPHRYIYTGTIGKVLPSFLVVGREAHVGEPYLGADANYLAAWLIRALSMNPDLCDTVGAERTPPPVTLHAADLKERYDVQLPFVSHFYLNVLTMTSTPAQLLARLRAETERALGEALAALDASERVWRGPGGQVTPREGRIYTWEDLRAQAVRAHGADRVAQALREASAGAAADSRARSVRMAWALWRLAGVAGPAVVLYFSPPWYPHFSLAPSSPLSQAVDALIAAHPDDRLARIHYYPYISDMSYLRLDPENDPAALMSNMPLWQASDGEAIPGGYALPLDAIRALGLDAVNLGPYGWGPHQHSERVVRSYSFERVPALVWELINRLAGE